VQRDCSRYRPWCTRTLIPNTRFTSALTSTYSTARNHVDYVSFSSFVLILYLLQTRNTVTRTSTF
jgi:hypothetical protein